MSAPAKNDLKARATRAIIAHAFFRVESALTIALVILLAFFLPRPLVWWRWWFWLILGGISEALITTAAGLFAAIPAVIAYNQFVQRLKEFGALMDDFGLEFLNMTERYFT